jgi:hypothetical protein
MAYDAQKKHEVAALCFVVVFCSYALFFDLPYPIMKHYCSLVLLSNNIYF